MHKLLVDEVVKNVRQRISEGDCPTVPPHSVGQLEDCIMQLATPTAGDGLLERYKTALEKILVLGLAPVIPADEIVKATQMWGIAREALKQADGKDGAGV